MLCVAVLVSALLWLVVMRGDSDDLMAPPERPVGEDALLPAESRSPATISGREVVSAEPRTEQGALSPAGTLRVQVDVAPGVQFPAHYELLIDAPPAPRMIASFDDGARLATIAISPGRSTLRGRAEGLASRPLVVVFDGTAAVAPPRLLLEPASRIGGQVTESSGAPLSGLPVALLGASNIDVRIVQSDAEGRYAFDDVPLGAYRVCFGAADGPIAPVVPVTVERNEVRDVPPKAMPDLGEGEIRVLDRAGQPVAGARVQGAGQRGGWIDGESDPQGFVRARFLPAGTYFLNVSAADGSAGQGPLEISIGRIGRAVVHIRQ